MPSKVPPQQLFDQYSTAATDLVRKLIWHYQSSGSLQFQDEAHSEGQLALWQACNRFDPFKQQLQVNRERQRQTEQFYSIIFGYEFVDTKPIDPYANFWMIATMRVRGGVLDFFRAQKLITKRTLPNDIKKLSKQELLEIKAALSRRENDQDIANAFGIDKKGLAELKPTMFYREKFVSLDRSLSDFGSGSTGDSFADVLPAPDISKQQEEQAHLSYLIMMAMQDAELSAMEMEVIRLCFNEDNLSNAEIARRLKIRQIDVKGYLEDALGKIKRFWPENREQRLKMCG